MAINYGKLNAKLTPRGSLKATMGVSGPLNSDYEPLINKPQINGNELIGNKTNADLGIPTALEDLTDDSTHRVVTDEQIDAWDNKSDFSGSYDDLTDKPTIPDELADLTDDSTHRLVTDTEKTTWNAKSDFSGSYNDLTNVPANLVQDANYVHTDNNYDDTAKGKVSALGTASTKNVPVSGDASTSEVVLGNDTRLTDSRNPNPHTHSKADITDFPTNVSAFNNDSGFITNTVNNLANYYLKSETYTRAEVEQLIAAIKQGKFEIVAELPASGDANVIYLVPKSTAQTSNSYDEYVYINNAWEKIGDTDIDLSGYVTDDELTTALQSYLTTSAFNTAIASYYTKTETDNLLANKVDKVAGKGLSTNDYDNTAKGIVDGVTSALNDKVDKVQGKGLSTNDYDNTAKGIVDGVTSALADKVDKVNGKGLSTEDYTTAEKSKLGDISDNAKKVASSSTNGHIEIDDVDTTVYDDSAVTTAIDNIEDELSTDYATVEGNPINFTTLSAQKSKSTILSVEPIQDLHGYDKPWVGGAGKNLLPMTVDGIKSINTGGTWNGNSYTINGVTFKLNIDNDGNIISISTSGTSDNANNTFIFVAPTGTLNISDNTDIILTGCPEGGSWGSTKTYALRCVNSTWDWAANDTGSGATISYQSNYTRFYIDIRQNVNMSNKTFYPMIRLATITDDTFEPYTNISSITGHDQIDILGCGKNLINWKYNPFNENRLQVVLSQGTYTISPQSQLLGGNQYIRGTKIDSEYCSKSELGLNNWGDSSFSGVYYKGGGGIVTFNVPEDNVTIEFGVLNTDGTIPAQLELGSTATTYSPYTPSTDLTISLGQTVYGGNLDVENGVLVVDKGIVDLGNYTWSIFQSTESRRYCHLESQDNAKPAETASSIANIISSHYNKSSQSNIMNSNGLVSFDASNPPYVQVHDEALNGLTAEEAKTYLTGVKVCYELAEPITINLTPHTIKLLEGINNISVDDDGATITLTYRDGSVATLEDITVLNENLEQKIADSQILTDTVTGDKYILVVTNGVLSVEQVSN